VNFISHFLEVKGTQLEPRCTKFYSTIHYIILSLDRISDRSCLFKISVLVLCSCHWSECVVYGLKEGLNTTEYDPKGLMREKLNGDPMFEEGMQSSFIIYVTFWCHLTFLSSMNGFLNNTCVLPYPSGSHHQHVHTTHSCVC
jgi:hypothetical protein